MQHYRFNKVAVIGSGTMGSQIAALLANLNIPVLLFDLDTQTVNNNLAKLQHLKPPPLAEQRLSDYIQIASLDDDLSRLKSCDLVIEAVVEDLAIKKQLFSKIQTHLNSTCLIATNTSGLSINAISQVLPPELQPRFAGVHFFNPPRFMALVELIASDTSQPQTLQKLEGFLTSFLGKEVVYAKDVAGFVANRIGVVALMATIYHAQQLGIAADTVDALTGKLSGKATSATFRTADMVGLDILKRVLDNLLDHQQDSSWKPLLQLPEWLNGLIEQGHLGQKTGQGIYLKKASGIEVYDTQLKAYRRQQKQVDKSLSKIIKQQGIAKALLHFAKSHNPQQQLLWRIHRDVMHYSALHAAEIAFNVADIDRALKAGFGWKQGVFELWQEAGIKAINQQIRQDIDNQLSCSTTALPNWLDEIESFSRQNQAYSPAQADYLPARNHPIYKRQLDITDFEVLFDSPDLALHKINDEVAVTYFKTKLANISYGVLSDLNKALDLLEQQGFSTLVLWSKNAGVFCAGANLLQVLTGCRLGRLYDDGGMASKLKLKAFELTNPNLPKLDYHGSIIDVVELGQNTMMRLKYGPITSIAAVDGLALGGGCELVLHCNHVIATINSYIGLVEVGVGILPAFGGSKEMLKRCSASDDPFKRASQHFEQIAMAKVSTSAIQAKQMHYLPQQTSIIANYHELLYSAIELAKATAHIAHYNSHQAEPIRPLGFSGEATILGHLSNLHAGQFMSDHDYLICQKIAAIFSGQVSDGELVSEQWLLDLERKYFMQLLETEKTQQRIEHMLKNNKPLRN